MTVTDIHPRADKGKQQNIFHAQTSLKRNPSLLQTAEDSFPHDLCNTCECFLGYLAQLRIDSDPADKDLFLPFKVEHKDMRKCLGCDPCPPGELYAEYMRKKQKSTLITI